MGTVYSQVVASNNTDIWTTNTSAATDTGTKTWSILNAAANTYICYGYFGSLAPAQALAAGQSWMLGITLRCPTGPAVTLAWQMQALDATSNALTIVTSPARSVGSGWTTFYLNTGTLPAGTTSLRLLVLLQEGTGAGRTLEISGVVARISALPDEIVSVALERDLSRTAEVGSNGLVLNQGPVGPRTGTLVYLCSTWDQVTQLEAVYRNGEAIIDDQTPILPVFVHYAVERLRWATERALTGKAARWLVTAQVRESS